MKSSESKDNSIFLLSSVNFLRCSPRSIDVNIPLALARYPTFSRFLPNQSAILTRPAFATISFKSSSSRHTTQETLPSIPSVYDTSTIPPAPQRRLSAIHTHQIQISSVTKTRPQLTMNSIHQRRFKLQQSQQTGAQFTGSVDLYSAFEGITFPASRQRPSAGGSFS